MRARIPTSESATPLFVAVLLAAFALGCDGSEVKESPLTPKQPTPAQATLTINLSTPNADDGIILFTVSGPSILDVAPGPGLEVLQANVTSGTSSTSTILVRGNLANGAVAQLTVRGQDLDAAYTAQVQSVAARASGGYARRPDLDAYRLTFRR